MIGGGEGALDRRVLVELAARAGVALDNAVLFGAERRLALTLQRSLLPTALPELPGIELAARYLPGRRRTATSAATSTSATRSRTAACC